MPVLGLVLTLEDGSPAGRGGVLELLLRERNVTIGDFAEAGRLPVVLEAGSRADGEARVRGLLELEGIGHVDVVFAHFEDLLPDSREPQPDETGEDRWS